jgi:hypothetical protein
MSTPTVPRDELDLPLVVVSLLKGVVYRDVDEKAWIHLGQLLPRVRDHVAVMGLEVEVSEDEGYAFLRQRPIDPDDDSAPPSLVARHRLSFPVSLLLALLRRRLVEFDAAGGDTRLVLHRDDIVELLTVFLPPTTAGARLVDQVDRHITKVVELGFLTRIRGTDDRYEVRRIITAFVDAQWLADLLAQYEAALEEREQP